MDQNNSITALVRVIANQEIDKRIEQLTPQKVINGSDFIASIETAVTKAGQPWTAEEDDLLAQEVKAAITVTAKQHSRSIGAILSRISQKQLLAIFYR